MREIDFNLLSGNVFDRIGKQWMLLAARNGDRYNMMTASWGGLGVLWNKNVATVYIRPQRYTLEFIETAPLFSLSFLPESLRGVLTTCGSQSGRDIDKMALPELTPVTADDGAVLFAQSELSLVCRKLYRGQITPDGFVDQTIDEHIYPQRDHHVVFIGEIIRVLGAS